MAMFWAVACLVVLGDGTVVQTKWVRCIFFVALQVFFDIARIARIDRIIFLFCNFAGWRGSASNVQRQQRRRQKSINNQLLSTMCR